MSTKDIRQLVTTPTHAIVSDGTAEASNVGYRPLGDFKANLGLGTSLTNTTVAGTLAVTGGQIAFPATAVPSANANTLDDYEEGTWTPIVDRNGGTVSISPTYSSQEGRYIRIGRLLYIEGQISLSAVAAGQTGTYAVIGGLPFLWSGISSFSQFFQAQGDALDSASVITRAYAFNGASALYLGIDNNSTFPVVTFDWEAGTIRFSGCGLVV